MSKLNKEDDASDDGERRAVDWSNVPEISEERRKLLEKERESSFKFFFVADRLLDLNLAMVCDFERNLMETLTRREMKTLRVVTFLTQESPNGVSLKELANVIQVSFPTASVLVDGLVKKGVLSRTINPENRRASLVKLSEVGVEFYRAANNRSREIFRELLRGASATDVRIFEKTLDRFYRNLIRLDGRILINLDKNLDKDQEE